MRLGVSLEHSWLVGSVLHGRTDGYEVIGFQQASHAAGGSRPGTR
jgi:hypothetical protein